MVTVGHCSSSVNSAPFVGTALTTCGCCGGEQRSGVAGARVETGDGRGGSGGGVGGAGVTGGGAGDGRGGGRSGGGCVDETMLYPPAFCATYFTISSRPLSNLIANFHHPRLVVPSRITLTTMSTKKPLE